MPPGPPRYCRLGCLDADGNAPLLKGHRAKCRHWQNKTKGTSGDTSQMADVAASTAPTIPSVSNAQFDSFSAVQAFGVNTDIGFDSTHNAGMDFDFTFSTDVGFDYILNTNMGFDSTLDADNAANVNVNDFDFGMFQDTLIPEAPRDAALAPISDAGPEISSEVFMQTFVDVLIPSMNDATNIEPPEVVVPAAPVAQVGQLVRTVATLVTDDANIAELPSQPVDSTENCCGQKRKSPTQGPDSEEPACKRMLLEESSDEMEDGWQDEDDACPGYIEDDAKRSKDYARRVKQSLKAAKLMDKRDRPYALIYFSRPESILARNGKAKLFISATMAEALAGNQKIMDLIGDAVRHHAQSSTMTYEEVKALNIKVSDAQAVTARERASRQQLELEVASLRERLQGHNENAK